MRKAFRMLIVCMMTVLLVSGVCKAESNVTLSKEDKADMVVQRLGKKAAKPGKPVLACVFATNKAEIKLRWTPAKNAQKYVIYRATSKKGKYKKIATTKKTLYVDKKGTQLKTYYYKVRAMKKNGTTKKWVYGAYSNIMKKKVRKIAKKTAYAGDSLTVGLLDYGRVTESESKKVFAKVGIGTAAYYNSDLLKDLLEYNPDRLFIMLGVNDLAGNPADSYMNTVIAYYKSILKACIKKNPDMEIFVMAVAPVGENAPVSMSVIDAYNMKMEDVLLTMDNVYYYDLKWDLADERGYLKPEYMASDGLHWKAAAYDVMLKVQKDLIKEY